MGSYGKCEICGEVADCHDVPSRWLPRPEKDPIPPVYYGD